MQSGSKRPFGGGQRLVHKLLRLYPMVFLSILVCLLLKSELSILTSDGRLGDLWSAKTLLVNFGLLFAGYPYLETMGINNPVWYVCVLIQCYLLFYLIEWGLSKLEVEKRSRWRLYIYVALACIALVTFRLRLLNEGSFRGIASFSIGVLLCIAHQTYRLEDILRKKWIGILLMALAVAFLKQRWVLQFFVFPAVVFGLSRYMIPGSKTISDLGDISFDLYVIHYPLMVLVKLVLAMSGGELVHSYGTMGVFLVVSWCIAGLMWKYIDLPSRSLTKQLEMKFCK